MDYSGLIMGPIVCFALMFILFFLGILSFVLVHEVSHLIPLKYYEYKNVEILKIENKPLWKQPFGIIALSAYVGEVIYLIFLLIRLKFFFEIQFGIYPVFSIGGVAGTTISLAIHYEFQKKEKRGDLFKYKNIAWLIREGCECGEKTFDLSLHEATCSKCGNVYLLEKEYDKKTPPVTPAHLNLLYLISKKVKEIDITIMVDAPLEFVFDQLASPSTEKFRKKFKIQNYKKISDNEWSFRVKGINVRQKLIEVDRPNIIYVQSESGVLNTKEKNSFRQSDGKTIIDTNFVFSRPVAEKLVRRGLLKQLNFIRREIEELNRVKTKS